MDEPQTITDIAGNISRRVWDDCVQWLPRDLVEAPGVVTWDYAVFKFPFVPHYHVCFMEDDPDQSADTQDFILSTHKTMHEAMGLCRLLLTNGGLHYE